MKVTIVSVGKIKEDYFKDSIEEYCKRLKSYCNLNRIEINDEKIIESKPDYLIKNKEGEKIYKSLNEKSYKIAMTETGKNFSSEELANFIENIKNSGNPEISFIIGGALGLSDDILKNSDFKLSLSKMTLPHQMAYLFLTEQIYRSFKIIQNEPYHK